MTYFAGQLVRLTTSIVGVGTAPAMSLTITAPDATVTTPSAGSAVPNGTGWTWTADVAAGQLGDFLYVWAASGSYAGVDSGQFHVIAPSLRIVGLAEVKEHGNITSTASDRELLDFIGTSQQLIEQLVGATVPQTVTETVYCAGVYLELRSAPVLSVTSVTEYGLTVDPGLYVVDTQAGTVRRTDGRRWYGASGTPVTYVYRAGRTPIPEGIRWAAKELTIALWRSTQAQRGGRGRGDGPDTPTGYALPNRVVEALAPFLLAPSVGGR